MLLAGVNVQPQGLNIGPTLIVIGPYDTTVAGQVRLPKDFADLDSFPHDACVAHCMLWDPPMRVLGRGGISVHPKASCPMQSAEVGGCRVLAGAEYRARPDCHLPHKGCCQPRRPPGNH